jgi:hypothetical protein
MLFPLFCMFDDYWRIHSRSQDSAGKRTVKIQYFWRPAILGKYPEIHISPKDGSSPKERARWATRGPHHLVVRASPRSRRLVVWPPWPTSAIAPSCISSPQKTKTRERIAQKTSPPLRGGKHIERESSPAGKNLPGKFLPGAGKLSPSSLSSSWASLGSSSSSPPSPPAPSSPSSPCRPTVTSWGESCLVHRGNFPGVDYYLWLMLLSGTVELRFMSRLFFIIISSLIMIHMMSCE